MKVGLRMPSRRAVFQGREKREGSGLGIASLRRERGLV